MTYPILIIWLPILIYLSFAVFYHVLLAIAFFLKADSRKNGTVYQYKYNILIPAYNEELMIGRLLESMKRIDYSADNFNVTVIADNCMDKTADIASEYNVDLMVRHDPSKRGKGFAIQWALNKICINEFDAVVIIDADNIVDPHFFHGLNEIIHNGSNAIQCNNGLANPDENAFTRIMHLSRTIDNELYHQAKYKLGLSSFLMGNGMCFTVNILKKYGWSTNTIAEDYEYYAKLINNNEMIGYSVNSRIYHQESKGIRHATNQRLRWSSGRFQVARKYGLDLIKKGIKDKNIKIIDASFPLILPNLSLMVNSTVVALFVSLVINFYYYSIAAIVYWLSLLLFLEVIYFFCGLYLTRMSILKFLFAFVYAPIFLFWKGCIDLKCIFGKKIEEWGKTKRL